MTLKTCTKCEEEKTLDNFYVVKNKGAYNRLTAWCKKCTNEKASLRHKTKLGRELNRKAVAQWKERNRRKLKNDHLMREYGINIEQYEGMLMQQNNRCSICSKDSANYKRKELYVDHCHRTKKIRGLLCQKCNQGLGLFDDNPKYLAEALAYINRSIANERSCET
jgi:hypothetical protein